MKFARIIACSLACFVAVPSCSWAQLPFISDFFDRHFYYDAVDENTSERQVNTGFSYNHRSGYFASSAAKFGRYGYERNLTTGYRTALAGTNTTVHYYQWGQDDGLDKHLYEQVALSLQRSAWRGVLRMGEDYQELEAGHRVELDPVGLDLSVRNRESLVIDGPPTREIKFIGTRGPIKWTTRWLDHNSAWEPRTLLEFNPTPRASIKLRYADQWGTLQREGAGVMKMGQFEIGTRYNSVQRKDFIDISRGIALSRSFNDLDMLLRVDNANIDGTRIMLELNLRNIADILDRPTDAS